MPIFHGFSVGAGECGKAEKGMLTAASHVSALNSDLTVQSHLKLRSKHMPPSPFSRSFTPPDSERLFELFWIQAAGYGHIS